MRDRPALELREHPHEVAPDLGDHARVDLHPPARPRARGHPPAGPAEEDAVVARGPQVVQQRAPVGDRLAAAPAELVEHVRYRLRHDDVARGDRQAVAQRLDRARRGVDGQDGRRRAHAAAVRPHLDAARRRLERPRLRPLEELRAAGEQPLAQAEGEPRGMHVRRVRAEHAAAEHRGGAACAGLLGRLRDHRLAVGRLGLHDVLRRRRRDDELAAAPVVGVDALGLAPRADRIDGLARRAHPGVAGLAVIGAQRVRAEVHRRDEAAVTAARPVPAAPALEQDHLRVRVGLQQVPRRPHAGVAAADDHDVRGVLALQRREDGRVARLGDPEPVRVVQHQPRWVATAAATAARSTSRSPRGTSAPIGSSGKKGSRPARPSRIARLQSGRCMQRVAALEHGHQPIVADLGGERHDAVGQRAEALHVHRHAPERVGRGGVLAGADDIRSGAKRRTTGATSASKACA